MSQSRHKWRHSRIQPINLVTIVTILTVISCFLVSLTFANNGHNYDRIEQVREPYNDNSDGDLTADEDYNSPSSSAVGAESDEFGPDPDPPSDFPDSNQTMTTSDDQVSTTSTSNIVLEVADMYKMATNEIIRQVFPRVIKRAYEFSSLIDSKCMASMLKIFYAIRESQTWALRCEYIKISINIDLYRYYR